MLYTARRYQSVSIHDFMTGRRYNHKITFGIPMSNMGRYYLKQLPVRFIRNTYKIVMVCPVKVFCCQYRQRTVCSIRAGHRIQHKARQWLSVILRPDIPEDFHLIISRRDLRTELLTHHQRQIAIYSIFRIGNDQSLSIGTQYRDIKSLDPANACRLILYGVSLVSTKKS